MSKIGNSAPVQIMSQAAGSQGSGGVVKNNGKHYVLTNEHVVRGAGNRQPSQITQGVTPGSSQGASTKSTGDTFVPNAEIVSNNPTIKIGDLQFQGLKTVVEKGSDLALIEIPPDQVNAVLAKVEPSKLPQLGEKPKDGTLIAQKPSPGGIPQDNSKITNKETVATSAGVTSSKLTLGDNDVKAGTSGTNVNGPSAIDGEKITFDVINSTTGSPNVLQNEAVATQLNKQTGHLALTAMFEKLGEKLEMRA